MKNERIVRRRAAIYRNGDPIVNMEVFERDQWICHLCGNPVGREYRLPDDRAATIDHIVPLALGGKHIWENIALAHAWCNFDKGCRGDYTSHR